MIKVENISRKHLVMNISIYLKKCAKSMTADNVTADIELHNWYCGFGRDSKWSYTEIRVDDTQYIVKDKEITDESFVSILNDAIATAKVRAKVVYDTYGDGYWTPKQTLFRRVQVFSKPCKEFIALSKYIDKYGNFTLDDLAVFNVRVCGKRSSWSDSGKYYYLCYNAELCKSILDDIRKNKGSKDILNVSVEETFSHGDDDDYRCAMHMESEWYGERGAKLHYIIKTPKGKVKVDRLK